MSLYAAGGRALYALRSGVLTRIDALANTPAYFILDTDMATDVDDLLAVRLMGNHVRSGRGECIAAVVSTRSTEAVKTTRYMLDLEGMADVPLGRVSSSYGDRTNKGAWHQDFAGVWTMTDTDVANMPDSTTVLMEALASVPNQSVDYQVVGHLGPLWALLEAPGGENLFFDKVKHLWIMGGDYPSGDEHNFSVTPLAAGAAQYVFSNGLVTVPITVLGFSVGDGVQTGQFLPSSDIVRTAYVTHGSSNGRSSWDPMLVELASSGGDLAANGYSSVQGTVNVASDGSNTFTADANGPHRYLTMVWTDQQFEDYLNPLCAPSTTPTDPPPDPVITDWAHRIIAPTVFAQDEIAPTVDGFARAPKATTDVVLQEKGNRAAFYFNGSSWLQKTSFVDLGTNFTVYAEFWLDALPGANGKMGMVMHDGGGSTNGRNWHMPIHTNGDFTAATFAGTAGADHPSGLVTPLGQWVSMVMVRAGDIFTLYLDGASFSFTRTGVNVTTPPLTIGGRDQGTGFDDQLVGWISEVRVYTVAHDAATVATVQAEMDAVADPTATGIVAGFTTTAEALAVTATSTASGDISSISWNWGDASVDTTGATSQHTYAATGTYTITQTVTANDGSTAVATADVTVNDGAGPVTLGFEEIGWALNADFSDLKFVAGATIPANTLVYYMVNASDTTRTVKVASDGVAGNSDVINRSAMPWTGSKTLAAGAYTFAIRVKRSNGINYDQFVTVNVGQSVA